MKRFSKFKKQIENLLEPTLEMEFCCSAYPMRTKGYASSSIPRFYVKLGKEIIWDYPKDFQVKDIDYGYWADNNDISELVREYIDTPVEELLKKEFQAETKEYYVGFPVTEHLTIHYGITDILKAADRRFSGKELLRWGLLNSNPLIARIWRMRFVPGFEELAKKQREQLAKQKPTTIEEARAQAMWLKTVHTENKKRNQAKGRWLLHLECVKTQQIDRDIAAWEEVKKLDPEYKKYCESSSNGEIVDYIWWLENIIGEKFYKPGALNKSMHAGTDPDYYWKLYQECFKNNERVRWVRALMRVMELEPDYEKYCTDTKGKANYFSDVVDYIWRKDEFKKNSSK